MVMLDFKKGRHRFVRRWSFIVYFILVPFVLFLCLIVIFPVLLVIVINSLASSSKICVYLILNFFMSDGILDWFELSILRIKFCRPCLIMTLHFWIIASQRVHIVDWGCVDLSFKYDVVDIESLGLQYNAHL